MEPKSINIYTIEAWHTWLKANHIKEHRVRVILHKKHTGKAAPTHRQMIEEAICFGWIDTTIKRIDADTFIRNFSKRNAGSKWSDNTLSYAARLAKEGRMSPEGMKFYTMGKAKPTHDHGIPKNPEMPIELKKALAKEPQTKKNFDTIAPSMKRTLFRYLLRAKLPATREKRVEQILAQSRKGKKDFFGSTNNV